MTLVHIETEPIIKPLLRDIRKLERKITEETKSEIYRIQEDILFWIIDSEYRIKGLKESLTFIKKFTKSINDIDKEIKKDVPYELYYSIVSSIKEDIKSYELRINILKSLMDSIVWKFCDNVEIKYLSFNKKKSPIIGKMGFLHEFHVLECFKREYKDKKIFFVLNDLTNCIKISDISVIGEYGLAQLLECKMSTKDDRHTRKQFSRAKKTLEFLEEGQMEVDKEYFVTTNMLDNKPEPWMVEIKKIKNINIEHEFTSMEECIRKAKVDGEAKIRVNDCITFVCSDLTKNPELTKEQKKIIKKSIKKPFCLELIDRLEKKEFFENLEKDVNKEKKESEFRKFLFDICQYNPRLGYRESYYLPFALFKIPEEYILDLLLDRIFFMVILDLDQLIKRLAQAGLKAKFINKTPLQHISIENLEGKKFICHDLFFRLGHELLSIDYFINILKFLCDSKTYKNS